MSERARLADTVPPTPGVNVRIQHTVVEGPDGPVQYFDRVEDGRLADWGRGVDPAAEVTIINEWGDELAILFGTLDPLEVLMSGRVVVLGDQGKLLEVVPILQSEATQRIAVSLAAVTDAPNGAAMPGFATPDGSAT